MSFHIYGHGICTDDIKTSIDKIKTLIAMAPNAQDMLKDAYADAEEDEITDVEEWAEFMGQGWSDHEEAGLATILAIVINELEGIHLLATTDSQCVGYLVMREKLPWHQTYREKNLTEESLNNIFHKYVSVLTDKPITIEYKDIEYD